MTPFELQNGDAYEVWCDVGGTFTDCFVHQPDGSRRCTKVLSSGLVKGTVSHWIDRNTFVDPLRRNDPAEFWIGAKVVWIDPLGEPFASQECLGFDPTDGRIQLAETYAVASELGKPVLSGTLDRVQCVRYELDCGLEAPVLAARLLLGLNPTQPLPPLQVRLGTTRGTNALLTRTGQPCALVTTSGFGDLLRIGYQERPDLFALNVCKRTPLHASVVEIDERMDANGSVLVPLDVEQAENELRNLFATGIRSIAVCLLHSYCNPVHESRIEQIARRIGFTCICISSQIAPKIKAVIRAETTLMDAYLTPIVQGYLQTVTNQFGLENRTHLRVMTSSGGLVSADSYRGKDSVLSGPAGGAVAIEAYSQAMKQSRCIGLDMGGTSTDVCRIDGKLQLENETIKAGVRMMVPTLAIHTVAAGGGSVCWFDGVRLRVGPQSAGSNPGPACYGRGGPLTITDLNLLSDRIDPATFPFTLDRRAAEQRLEAVLSQMNGSDDLSIERFMSEQLCDGFRRIANEHMAAAVRSISIAQGADPREHALIGFGGAAGQHICEIAELLGIQHVIDPPNAGLLSALGMGMASVKRSFSRAIYRPLEDVDSLDVSRLVADMNREAFDEFDREGIASKQVSATFEMELKYTGTEGSMLVSLNDTSSNNLGPFNNLRLHRDCIDRFEAMHRTRFGYLRKGKPIEAVSLKGDYCAKSENQLERITLVEPPIPHIDITPDKRVHLRGELAPGQSINGPALIVSSGSTTALEKGWRATVLSDHTLSLRRIDAVKKLAPERAQASVSDVVDPVLREVLAQRIAAIADQMGIVLEQTAISVNVKDRRDFSCAVFACNGDLIANAPHVPVHLGAMSETIRCMLVKFPKMFPGDCFLTNDPYEGGSHLPDVTVITPVFVESQSVIGVPDFFVACRAHHAEIGGIAPGSMSPTSTRLGEEGVIIPPMHLVQQGIDCSWQVESLLRNAAYPSRSVAENMADLAAQQAANQQGLLAMQELSLDYGLDTLKRYLEYIQQASEAKTRAWIRTLGNRVRSFADKMDDGTGIRVSITPTSNEADEPVLQIDFAGTGMVSKGNLNANPAIVAAATMYVIRCALADSLPLNSGVLRCVEMKIPQGILNPKPSGNQEDWPAVAGGNVETSQRVVDCLLGALGLAAASQGTMNNFLFGDSTFGYYETIGGGTGATHTANGEDAVHSHMTNTRLTDVEVLEKRYPVRLVRFGIRQGSGGHGQHSGGDGMIRQIQALKPLVVSLVTSRRSSAPFGLDGGAAGEAGENWLIQKDGTQVQLPSSAHLSIVAGESILIETPGGGGVG